MKSGITVENINKSYGEKEVLKDLSLEFAAGDITCIEGPSGCGKTTLLRILSGLEEADSGMVCRDTENLAFVFQEDRLSENFSALRNVLMVTGKKLSEEELRAHFREVGLSDAVKKPVRELSGGMKRRVAIVRAVAFGADILFMDEPFKGLDSSLKITVMDYVKRHTAGKTVIFVTHDAAEAAYMGGRIVSL